MSSFRYKIKRGEVPFKYKYKRLHTLHLDVLTVLFCVSGWFLLPSFDAEDYGYANRDFENIMFSPADVNKEETFVFSPEIFAFGKSHDLFWEDAIKVDDFISNEHLELNLSVLDKDFEETAGLPYANKSPWPFKSVTANISMPSAPIMFSDSYVSEKTYMPESVVEKFSGEVQKRTVFVMDSLPSAAGKTVGVLVIFDIDGNAEAAILEHNDLTSDDILKIERNSLRIKGKPDSTAYLVYSWKEISKIRLNEPAEQ